MRGRGIYGGSRLTLLGRPMAYDPTKPLPPRKWVLENILAANTVTLFSGDSGSGKSYITLCMALAIVRGEKWCGFDTMDWPDAGLGRVLYIDNENDEYEVQQRMRDIGMTVDDFSRIRYFNRVGVQLGDGDWLERTLDEIEDFKPSLVVIDTATSATTVAASDGDSVARLYAQVLRPLASPTCAVMIQGHEKKTPEGQKRDARNAAIGSVHWRTQADGMLSVSSPGKLLRLLGGRRRHYPLVLEMVKSRGGELFRVDMRISSEHEVGPNGKWRTVRSWIERRPDETYTGE